MGRRPPGRSTSATPSSPTTSSPRPAASRLESPTGTKLPVIVGEKGSWWCTLRVRGTPGHASQPYRTDNALVTAAEVVRRLADVPARRRCCTTCGGGSSASMGYPDDARRAAARRVDGSSTPLEALPLGMARQFHACTHTTIAPDGRARRHEDQRHPRHRRPRARHPHAARPGRGRRAPRCSTRRSATSRDKVEIIDVATTTRRPRRRSTRRCGTRFARVVKRSVPGRRARAVPHRRRDRRPLLPSRRVRPRTASGCSAGS